MASEDQAQPGSVHSAQVVGNAFVHQYYHILHQSPELVHRFYQDDSKLGRAEIDGTMGSITTMQAINEKILSLDYGEYRAELKTVDAQESLNNGVIVLVTGYLTGKDNVSRNFTQSFFLAPQDKGYFVLNDVFRYMEDVTHQNGDLGSVDEANAPLSPDQDPSPVQDNHYIENTAMVVEEETVKEVIVDEVYNPSENGECSVVEEETPVPEVVDAVPNGNHVVIETNFKVEEVPKKSYASIVKVMKDSALPALALPPPRTLIRSQEFNVAAPTPTPTAEVLNSSSDGTDNGNSQEGEADGYSIYIKGLPMNATPALLEDEFKKFGPIKSGGIQVRSNRGFCFGFVEFEVASAVQSALEASPIMLNGRPAHVEEKKSSNSRGNNRGRFQGGRGVGFRNEGGARGGRGGNYGGGGGNRNYNNNNGNNRSDFNNRNEFPNNRGGNSNRGGGGGGPYPNRGGDVFQRDHTATNGAPPRVVNRAPNAATKTIAP